MKNTIPFNKKNMIINEPIIIYGASAYGELAYLAIKKINLSPLYFCDRHRKGKCFDTEIISTHDLCNFLNANIIIASRDYFAEMKEYLIDIGCNNIFDMRDLLEMDLPTESMSTRARDMYLSRAAYMDITEHQDDTKINFHRIQFVVTERCSLKCRDCTHLMQYYTNPQDVDIDEYGYAFERFLNLVDNISELRVLGGEPFMNKSMNKVILKYAPLDKIRNISIYTNGTIIPTEETLNSLKNEKVTVRISNYVHNEKSVISLASKLKQHGIKHFIRKYDSWQEGGNLDYRGYSNEAIQEVFFKCYERNCYTFLRGKLHHCPRSAHAMNITAMPDVPEDYVDFTDINKSDEILRKHLIRLRERTWIEACNYCQGPDYAAQGIPAAIQTPVPLVYQKTVPCKR